MVGKRKAVTGAQGPAKAPRVSQLANPGSATPRSIDSPTATNTPLASDEEDFDDDVDDNQLEKEKLLDDEASRFVNRWALTNVQNVARPKHFRKDAVSSFFNNRDFSFLQYKPDHQNRPLWINPEKGIIVMERFNPLADQATDFLITIAEPVSRPTFLHEYRLTTHSLYAAVSVGLDPKDILNTLDRFLKTPLPTSIREFIEKCTSSYGKVKLVLKNNQYLVESTDKDLLKKLLNDEEIRQYRVVGAAGQGEDGLQKADAPKMGSVVIPGTSSAAGVQQAGLMHPQKQGDQPNPTAEMSVYTALNDDDDDEAEDAVHSFQIMDEGVEKVQQRCLDLNFPILEEYDFRNDDINANLEIDLRPNTQIRPYQEKSLSKMFGNGRAKSGIIVLPCGAGKTLVGITAACTIKKGVVVLCTSTMSVMQWRAEFLKWSNIKPEDISVLTADSKEVFTGNTGIIVTTYHMVSMAKKRSAHNTKKVMEFLESREWGLMLLDEVHVVPAGMFRRVVSSIKAHSKLGLTATLVREDDKISHLNFLIGPKLYEANWMELSQQGHIAKVQCAEVWCPMTTEFYDEYLRAPGQLKRTLSAMNPRKFQACQYLINYHESRGDKIIVFSDELFPLMMYAERLGKPYIYGGTNNNEREHVLANFQHNPDINTLFLSKIGDTSLDLPEATCLIQISSHFGSRRQEAQRLGRILRAKRRNDEGFNAFFYTLVSKDTQEMYYASRRQTFLVDQGYAFKVITQLANLENVPDLAFREAEERRELLQTTLLEFEKGLRKDIETDDLFNVTGKKKGKGGARRTAGTLGELSGGSDMAYIEQNKSANKTIKKNAKGGKSDFFKKLDRDRERARKAVTGK
jgi:DNA excision repair protein ERCC-3